MSTQTFLTLTKSPLGGTGKLAMSAVRGNVATNSVTATTSGGTVIPCTNTSGGSALTWDYQVGAGTISGNVTANIRAKEDATATNAGVGIKIELLDSTGTFKATLLAQQALPTGTNATELTTTDAAMTLTSVALSTQTSLNGDIVRTTINVQHTSQSMAVGSVTMSYNGPTASAIGDSSVTYATSLPVYDPGAPTIGATGTSGQGSTSSTMAPGVPAGITAANQLSIGFAWSFFGTTTTPTDACLTRPSVGGNPWSVGWSMAYADPLDSGVVYAILMYHWSSAAETGTTTFTWNNVGGTGTNGHDCYLQRVDGYTGAPGSNPFVDSLEQAAAATTPAPSVTVPSFTPGADLSLLVAGAAGNGTMELDPLFLLDQWNTPGATVIGHVNQKTAAATGGLVFTQSVSDSIFALIGTIRNPAPAVAPQPSVFNFTQAAVQRAANW